VFAKEVASRLTEEDIQGKLETDGSLSAEELNLDIANIIRDAGPWGQCFPEPVFDGVFNIIEQHIVGRRHLKMILQPEGSEEFIDAIAFNVNLTEWPNNRCEQAHIAYKLDLNEFRGRIKLQLLIENLTIEKLCN